MNRWLLPVLGAVLCLGVIPFNYKVTSELPVYTRGAARMLAGQEIYRVFARDGVPAESKPFTYPPFFAVPFLPLAVLPRPAVHIGLRLELFQRTPWYLVNVLLLLWILRRVHAWVVELRRGPPGRGGPSPVWFWLLALLLAGRHVSSVFENQSHDLLVFAGVVAAAGGWRRLRPVRAGAWAGLAAACKATPLLFAVPLAARWWLRALGALGVALVLATVLPDLLLPRAEGGMWVVAWWQQCVAGLEVGGSADAGTAWGSHSYLNQSLSGTLTRLFVPYEGPPGALVVDNLNRLDAGTARWLLLACQLVVVFLVFLAGRWRAPADERLAALQRLGVVAAVVCGMVLLSPMSSKSHFCVLLLPVAVGLAHVLYVRRQPAVVALLAVVFAAGTLTVKELVKHIDRGLGNVLLAYGVVTWATVAALAASLCVVRSLGRAAA